MNGVQIENLGERDVYENLRLNAPADWFVRYHYIYTWRQGKYLVDGEIDFIILIPKLGLIVLEVKSSYGYDCTEGQWYRVNEKLYKEKTRNPIEQAMGNKHRIVSKLSDAVFKLPKEQFPGRYAYSVVYPRGKFKGSLPDFMDPSLIITHKDMPNLIQRIHRLLSLGMGFDERFNRVAFTKVKDYLSDRTKLVPVIAPNISDDEKILEGLSVNQYHALKGLLDDKRIHIKGGAGSGKTLLAKWSAEHKASHGKSVLLTCFNRNLAGWLKEDCSSSPAIETYSFFALARKVIVSAGMPFQVPSEGPKIDRFWKEEVPIMVCEALDKVAIHETERYDCVIVDEAQDFAPNWWLPLQLLLKDPDDGIIQIFSDEEQRGVYGANGCIPSGLIEIPLKENCRNTRSITTFSGHFIRQTMQSFTLSPTGEAPLVYDPVWDARSRAAKVRELFSRLWEQGFRVSQVAILSPYSLQHDFSSLSFLKKIRDRPLTGDSNGIQGWRNSRLVWASTIKAFKGLEADCIILTDIGSSCIDPSTLSEFYVGCTRAKHQLHILPQDSDTCHALKGLLPNVSDL